MRTVTDLWINDDITLITVDRMPNGITSIARVFGALADEGINVDMISHVPQQKETISISFSVEGKDFAKTLQVLGRFQKVLGDDATQANAGNVKLTVHGDGMRNEPGVAANVFAILAENEIEVSVITTSETEISFLVDAQDCDKAIDAIKEKFDL